MVMEMIRAGEVREDNDDYRSPLDELFDRLEWVVTVAFLHVDKVDDFDLVPLGPEKSPGVP